MSSAVAPVPGPSSFLLAEQPSHAGLCSMHTIRDDTAYPPSCTVFVRCALPSKAALLLPTFAQPCCF